MNRTCPLPTTLTPAIGSALVSPSPALPLPVEVAAALSAAAYDFWSPNNELLSEIGPTSNNQRPIRDYIYLGNERVAMVTGTWATGMIPVGINPITEGSTYFLQGNHLGATIRANEFSLSSLNTGVVMWADYTPFGDKVLTGTGFDIGGLTFGPGLPGQYQDNDGTVSTRYTHPVYNGRRYYLPWLGIYTQPEPVLSVPGIVEAYGVAGVPLNAYSYAANNPQKYIDPSGRDIWIEGPSGDEPPGHQGLCVGSPMGAYDCVSFGISPEALLGSVYQEREEDKGGEIQKYMPSTLKQDEIARRYLQHMAKVENVVRVYGIHGTCRGYSQDYYNNLKDLLELKEATPPTRPVAPQSTEAKARGWTATGASGLAALLILRILILKF